ncbi:hypothetical protein PENCOP_c006G09045 [Penicillium coprophilum]|uniref:Uncharacterized protein n=1 Tax=Penicillium coprophilum TaxID=36646 RepID=A0A1V6UN39_9EURO|nr:hypothetical protein PENCOP_c006G09045 [Penicillium coprophilum]
MDDKIKHQVTPGVFVPYTDEEHAEARPAPAWFYQPSQQRQSKLYRVFYVTLVAIAFCSAGFAVGRYAMQNSPKIIIDSTTAEPMYPLSESTADNATLALVEHWQLFGFTDTACTKGVRSIDVGNGYQGCTAGGDRMNGVQSFKFVGLQERPDTGVCIYGGTSCGRNNAYTSESKRGPQCVTLPRPGAATRFLVQALNNPGGGRVSCPSA